jgi:hypothetical protein
VQSAKRRFKIFNNFSGVIFYDAKTPDYNGASFIGLLKVLKTLNQQTMQWPFIGAI